MKKICLLILLFATIINCRSDEGMWLFTSLSKKHDKMKEMGLILSQEDFYHETDASIEDAIVKFGENGTGIFISEKGLLLTSYYNAYPYLQKHSTLTENYLANGFWAENSNDEKPNPSLSIKILIKTIEVTNTFISALNDQMSFTERKEKIEQIAAELIKKETGSNNISAELKTLYNGNEFYIFVYQTYTDVRLVGAPPESIANFGGDSDNWVWPRHSGNFAIFRVYASASGNPAAYSSGNIPYKPKKFLPCSATGVKENEFCFTIGYPKTTYRFLSRYGIKSLLSTEYPGRIKFKKKTNEILFNAISAKEELNFKYASKLNQNNNLLKFYLGLQQKIKKNKILENKKKEEDEFRTWATKNDDKKRTYASTIGKIMQYYRDLDEYYLLRTYVDEFTQHGPQLLNLASKFLPYHQAIINNSAEKEAIKSSLFASIEKSFIDYDNETDKKLFIALLELFYNEVDPKYHPLEFSIIGKKYKKNFTKYGNATYLNTIFNDHDQLIKFLNNPDLELLESDPIFKLVFSLEGSINKFKLIKKNPSEMLQKETRIQTSALMKMRKTNNQYPDANSTIRFTYGKISGFSPGNAVLFRHQTSLKGLFQKRDEYTNDYAVHNKLVSLYEKGELSKHKDKEGKIPVCFIANLDVTSGNSGSPVINKNGEVTGVIFDINYEALSGDFKYNDKLHRAIAVDMRYILLLIENFADNDYLTKEMNIIK